jgi:hypothetical protein
MKVLCVLRSGGDYNAEYVYRLKAGVDANLTGHQFICLSDVDVPGVDRIPLLHDWQGWWSKIELFRVTGPALYFDLDTIITKNITALADAAKQYPMIMLRDFSRDTPASGVMAWSGNMSKIYSDYKHDSNYPGHGDQGYIGSMVKPVYWQNILPGAMVSRKFHRDREGASVVCYHGQPRPHHTGWSA